MPDFHIKMNKVGTIIFAKQLKPTEEYPEPWYWNMEQLWKKSSAYLEIKHNEIPLISMIIETKDMCSAIRILDARRIEEINREIL